MIFRLFKRKDEFHRFVEKLIGTTTTNIALYRLAVTHPSASRECNERLEFLGDAIIGSSVSLHLYKNLPNEREGSLTNTKCKIVSRSNLNKIALDLNLGDWILSKSNVPISENALGNTFEALMGALYLDKGSVYTESRILELLDIRLSEVESQVVSYKSEIIELCQRWKMEYAFDVSDVGSSKNPCYKATLRVADVSVAEGFGNSKKKAEEAASEFYVTKMANAYSNYQS